MVVLLNPHIS